LDLRIAPSMITHYHWRSEYKASYREQLPLTPEMLGTKTWQRDRSSAAALTPAMIRVTLSTASDRLPEAPAGRPQTC
jgi:hypothetical protein